MIEFDIRAGQPIIYLVSPEEGRAELQLIELAKDMKRPFWTWSVTEGFRDPIGKREESAEDPIEALGFAREQEEGSLVVMKDLHPFFEGPAGARVRRMLRDLARDFKQQMKCLILLSPVKKIPEELERDMSVVEFDLPDEKMLGKVWDGVAEENKKAMKKNGVEPDEDEREVIVSGARGLTTVEAETAYSKAIVERVRKYKDDPNPPALSKLVLNEKAQQVKKTGILEYFDAVETANDVGGLDDLKLWLQIRKNCFSKKAREFPLPNPRGILLVGLPGCGKSLTAKAASNIFGVPLIKFDISRLFGGIVGMSETNTRTALKTIDALGNCIVWIDEMEKAFAGMGNSNSSDSGVTQRIFGMILTWMQEKTSPSFMVATVNNVDSLPSELLRKGRLDEIFYVSLPTPEERRTILDICIRRNGRDPEKLDSEILDTCAKDAKDFSGAELNEAVISGMYYAFYKNKDLHPDYIWGAIQNTTPLAVSRKQQLAAMRKWAEENAVPASPQSKKEGGKFGRKLFLGDMEPKK